MGRNRHRFYSYQNAGKDYRIGFATNQTKKTMIEERVEQVYSNHWKQMQRQHRERERRQEVERNREEVS